jgi:integrase
MLSDAKCRNADHRPKPYKLTDGGGLFLLVTTNKTKLWNYKFRLGGKENVFAIGAYPTIGLAAARTSMGKAKALVKEGISPNHARQASRQATTIDRGNTFESIAKNWIAAKQPHWSKTYHLQVSKVLSTDVYPAIGMLPIKKVNPAHLLSILNSVQERDASKVAVLIRQWCGAIFRYAQMNLITDTNPADALKGVIQRKPVKHHIPLDQTQLVSLMTKLETYGGMPETVIAVKLLCLTFLRTGELRQAKWADIDFAAKRWNVPAEMMKKDRPHIVPLSSQAIDLLRLLQRFSGTKEQLFPNIRRPKACMSNTTINRALQNMGFAGKGTIGFSGHGFRATASTMLNERGYHSDWIELQLSHAPRDQSRAAYNQTDHLIGRTKMMQIWADLLDGFCSGSNVLPFRASAA